MAIHTIQNQTGAQLELWDIGTPLAILANGQAVNNIDVTITSVTRANVSYHNKQGGFQHNDSYLATLIPEGGVKFQGNSGVVTFR